MGIRVQGAECVKTTPVNDTSAAALYIVGGTANDTSYQGLQRYTFANQSWETIYPTVSVTENRLYHGAIYLNTSDSILVYAGTQDGSKQYSSQTFTIGASPPYSVIAYEADAPPAISPILIPWSQSKAMYFGGSETNTKVMIFSPSLSWVDSNATLADPVYNTSAIKAVVIDGNDASKNLYTFDMTVSPNSVNRTILVDAGGNAVQKAVPVQDKSTVKEVNRRNELTVANWPPYNSSLAPMSTRTSYSVAVDQSGLVLVSGGNDEDVLCMFSARGNDWVNSTARLGSKSVSQQGLGFNPSSSVSPSASATASSPAQSTTAAAGDPSNPPFPLKILAAVLGSIVGVALILLATLLCLRWRRKQKQHTEAGHQRRASGVQDEKNSMDFADKGMPQMTTTRQFQNHEQSASQGSYSSMAILMGRVGHKRSNEKGNGSVGSTASSNFNKNYKGAISKPIPQEQPFRPAPVPDRDEKVVSFAEERQGPGPANPRPRGNTKGGRRGSTRRSSGWNRYWSAGSSLNILGLGSKRTTYEESDRSSEYSMPSRASAIVPPLKIGDRPELNRVISGSPTVAHHATNFPLTGESGKIVRSGSISSVSSYNDDRHDAFSSGVPASVNEQNTWTPVEGAAGWNMRASNYSESNYATTLGRNTSTFNNSSTHPPPPKIADMSWLNLGGNSNSRI